MYVPTYIMHFSALKYSRKLPAKIAIGVSTRLRYYSTASTTTRKISTVDKHELEFFSNLSGSWWDNNGILKLLLTMNKVRVPLIQKYLTDADLAHTAYSETKTPLRGIRLLDVGCGGGILSELLAKLGADVTGLDASPDLLKIAQQHMMNDKDLQKHLRYQVAMIDEFSQTHAECYDAIISSEVIEHVNEPELFVKHCIQCLKPGGSIIFTTMDRTPIGGLLNIFLHEDVLKVMPKGTHEYKKFIRPQELQIMLNNYDCKTVGVQGFTVNSFTANWFKVPVTWFNYGLHAIKSGPYSNQENVCKYAHTQISNEK